MRKVYDRKFRDWFPLPARVLRIDGGCLVVFNVDAGRRGVRRIEMPLVCVDYVDIGLMCYAWHRSSGTLCVRSHYSSGNTENE